LSEWEQALLQSNLNPGGLVTIPRMGGKSRTYEEQRAYIERYNSSLPVVKPDVPDVSSVSSFVPRLWLDEIASLQYPRAEEPHE